jgi:hypothetical protein
MHPMSEDLSKLTETQIEQKMMRLNSIYFMTGNDAVRQQMILLTDTYKLELEERRLATKRKQQEQGKDDLDDLIKIN